MKGTQRLKSNIYVPVCYSFCSELSLATFIRVEPNDGEQLFYSDLKYLIFSTRRVICFLTPIKKPGENPGLSFFALQQAPISSAVDVVDHVLVPTLGKDRFHGEVAIHGC